VREGNSLDLTNRVIPLNEDPVRAMEGTDYWSIIPIGLQQQRSSEPSAPLVFNIVAVEIISRERGRVAWNNFWGATRRRDLTVTTRG
jgi:hypothetical protein